MVTLLAVASKVESLLFLVGHRKTILILFFCTMEKVKALLFDFDGTLVNTERFHFEMLNELLEPYQGSVTWEEYTKVLMGVPFSKNSPLLIERFKLPMTSGALVERFAGHIEKAAQTHPITPMPGVVEALMQLKGIRKAIVTGSGRESVTRSMRSLGWSDQFEFWVTFDDVEKSKPHPESYLKAIEKLGVQKEEVVVFEDTENGTKSAKAAGLTCLAIQQIAGYHDRLTEADEIFPSINEAMDFLREKELI